MATSFRTVILFAIWCCSALIAQDLKSFKEIANRWHPEVKITQHVEDGPYGYVEAAEVRTNNDGAKWCFEPVPGTNYVRIENDFEEMYIHAQYGKLSLGKTIPDWKGAWWSIEKITGTDFVEIRNVLTNGYLHIERGQLELSERTPGWNSSQWSLSGLPSNGTYKNNPGQAPKLTIPETTQNGVTTRMPNKTNETFEWRFEWQKVNGATAYEVYVAREGATAPLIDFASVSTEFFVKKFKSSQSIKDTDLTGWFVNVRAIVNNKPTAWTKRVAFEVEKAVVLDATTVTSTTAADPVKTNSTNTGIAKKSNEPKKELTYTIEIFYKPYGALNNTGTKNEITINAFKANKDEIFFQKFTNFTTPEKPWTVSFPSMDSVAYLWVSTSGDDAFWIDQMVLKTEQGKVASWGVIGGKGYCLSTNPNDANTAPLKDFINLGCNRAVAFYINGKTEILNFDQGGQ